MLFLTGMVVAGCGLQVGHTYFRSLRNLTYVLSIDCMAVYSIGILTTFLYLVLNPDHMF